jgi:D-amino-acid dehydrogenase
MMPNMLPRVGPGRQANVFYNTGHGHLGWTLSAITAHQLADHVQTHFARPARTPTLAIQQQGEHHGSIRI